MRARDAVHGGLMLAALAAAYVLPFELLLLSYAILGPAHYFTEISWLQWDLNEEQQQMLEFVRYPIPIYLFVPAQQCPVCIEDLDLAAYGSYLAGEMVDRPLDESAIEAAMLALPAVTG